MSPPCTYSTVYMDLILGLNVTRQDKTRQDKTRILFRQVVTQHLQKHNYFDTREILSITYIYVIWKINMSIK